MSVKVETANVTREQFRNGHDPTSVLNFADVKACPPKKSADKVPNKKAHVRK